MQENLHSLIKDALSLFKDPLFEERTFFVSESCKHHFGIEIPSQKSAPLSKAAPLPTPPSLPPLEQKSQIPTNIPSREINHPIPSPVSTSNIHAALQKIVPSLRLTDKIPDDREGKKSANLWKEKLEGIDIVLLALSQEEETLELLKSLAKAINERLGRAKIISAVRLESNQNWDLFFAANSFRLVIVSEGIEKYPLLSPFLKNIPSFSLERSLIYKQIEKKAILWKSLCQLLQ